MEHKSYDDWIAIFETGLDYEAGLVRDRLRDADIPAVIMNKRDHAYNLTLGDMAQIKVMVPAEMEKQARSLLNTAPLSDKELEEAALAANPFDDEVPEEEEDAEEDQ